MTEENPRRKPSLISIMLIFVIIISITFFVVKEIEAKDVSNKKRSILDVNSPEYLATKKVEIESYLSSLNELYGINVYYGDDTTNYASKVNASVITDLTSINSNLKVLFYSLQKYPQSMFEQFKNKEYKLDIILLDKFNNNNIALASKNNLNEVKLYVSNAENLERAIHHELFHIFEYYISDKDSDVFKDWNTLNPKDFTYEAKVSELDNKYVYLMKSVDNDIADSFFLTKYSKTSEKEDRAEIFAEMMMLTKDVDYLENGTNIRRKADSIIGVMSNHFSLKNLYFMRFIK